MSHPTGLVQYCTPYDEKSGGVRAFYYLRELLGKAGYRVRIVIGIAMGKEELDKSEAKEDEIAIYPDCINGNPVKASRIVRYFGYYASVNCPGFWNGSRIPKQELAIPYNELVYPDLKLYYDGVLPDPITIPHVSRAECYPKEKTIPHLLYVPGFNGKRIINTQPRVSPLVTITRFSHPRNEALDMLRHAENFYTVDNYTAMTAEATLCGCKVWVAHGADDFREYEGDVEKYVISLERDIETARKFAKLCFGFFGGSG